ncbi:MAG: hypothetical protein EOP53_00150 [Sphingobacteriales bacterium]|nr:MAG: hypothetical protein EOP53_00150 [Sphingobacteriales bacterium]
MALAYGASAQNALAVHDTINFTDPKGNKQGVWRENFNTSLLKRETIYKDGLKNGLDLLFFQFPNCIKEESEYRNDTLVRRISYHRNCNVKMVESFRKGQREGYTKVYNKDGILETEGLYKNGKLQGTLKHYDRNGIPESDNDLIVSSIKLEGYLNGDIPVVDSTVINTLNRIPLTKNTVIVTDVTGSMHRSVGQLLLWYSMYMGKTPVSKFVFFNDGDGMPDLKKKLGRTGGIYSVQPEDIADLKNVMELAITKGTGGDLPENNIEASLEALAKFKNTDQLILIVDRRSPVKDISLLKKLKIPVHIVLCGPEEVTHPHYLQIAYKTKGNIYSLNSEVKNISNIQEGQKLKIANLTFAFKDGQFRRVKS